jgi:hypothetical protein
LRGQKGIKVEVGSGKCFETIDDLSFFLIAIEQQIENYLGYSLLKGTYIEKFKGNDSNTYYTRVYPIESITSITYTTDIFTTVQTVNSMYYRASKYSINLLDEFDSNNYYTLTYIAGNSLEDIPNIIKQSIIEQASLTLQDQARGILVSESYNTSKLVYQPTPTDGLYPQVEQKLKPYKSQFSNL